MLAGRPGPGGAVPPLPLLQRLRRPRGGGRSSTAGSRALRERLGGVGVIVRPHPKRARAVGRRRASAANAVVWPRRTEPSRRRGARRLLRLDRAQRGRRRRQHERDDRGGDRRQARLHAARARVRAGPGRSTSTTCAASRAASCTSPSRSRSTSTSSPAAWSTRQRCPTAPGSFVADFVRPGGVDRSATVIYADAVEELALLPAPEPERPAPAVRAALTPLAAVSSIALSLRVGKAAVTSKLPGTRAGTGFRPVPTEGR